MLSFLRRAIFAVIAVSTAAAASVLVVAAASPASADECAEMGFRDGAYVCIRYVTTTTPGTPGGNGGTTAPTCKLAGSSSSAYSDANRTPNYCIGTSVCFNTDIIIPYANPKGDPPTKDSKGRMTWCYDSPFGDPTLRDTFWSDEEEPPTLLEQAQEAIGNIDLGAPTLQFSPETRTLVNLDTWFWLDGAQEEVTGSSAFGLVAIATFQSMSVDPGDGSGTFGCPFVTSSDEAKDSCTHTYRRASNGGSATVDGRPAYAPSVTSVYGLRFEINGNPVAVPGAPATLDADPAESALRVDELQSRVTRLN